MNIGGSRINTKVDIKFRKGMKTGIKGFCRRNNVGNATSQEIT